MSEFDGLMEEGIVQDVCFWSLDRGRYRDDLLIFDPDCPWKLESSAADGNIVRGKINQCIGHEV
jgi:hypothetical protein